MEEGEGSLSRGSIEEQHVIDVIKIISTSLPILIQYQSSFTI